jgi:hypothetical protein
MYPPQRNSSGLPPPSMKSQQAIPQSPLPKAAPSGQQMGSSVPRAPLPPPVPQGAPASFAGGPPQAPLPPGAARRTPTPKPGLNPTQMAGMFAGNLQAPAGMQMGQKMPAPAMPAGMPSLPGGMQAGDKFTPPTGGGAGGTPADPGAGNMDDLNKLYEDILGQHDASWAEQQKLLQSQMGAGQRSADNLNARMGRSIGGGYSQLQGQAMAGGMRAMSQAKLSSDEQRRGVMLDWLEKQLGEKQRQEERGWAQEDMDAQAPMDFINMLIASGEEIDTALMAQLMSGEMTPEEYWAQQGDAEPTSYEAAGQTFDSKEEYDKWKKAEALRRQLSGSFGSANDGSHKLQRSSSGAGGYQGTPD